MYNLSTQELVLSIEKSPLLEKHGIVYQEYTNFFDNLLISKIKNEIDNLKLVKLEQQETIARQRADYNETLCKELKIIFLNQKITQALENKFNTKSSHETIKMIEKACINVGFFQIVGHGVDLNKIKTLIGDSYNIETLQIVKYNKGEYFGKS